MSAKEALKFLKAKIETSGRIGRMPDGTQRSCMTFRDYMNFALYHPDFGYYRSGTARVGREGDFYTSAYIGDIMGEQLADWLNRLASDLYPDQTPIDVVDWGGGTGRLAGQMLAAWQQAGEAGDRFRVTVVDGNPAHLVRAEETLAEYIAAGRAGVASAEEAGCWHDRQTIVVANELLDAFPVHRVTCRDDELREWGVAWDAGEGRLAPCLTEPSDPGIAAWIDRQGVRLVEGQTTEIGLDGAAWLSDLSERLGSAVIVFIDYGDGTAELTGPHRMDGTLLMYERHQAHADPFRNPGEQDMTAHVDFDLIRDRAVRLGWQAHWYGTQKQFLVDSGVLGKLVRHDIADPFHPVARRNRAIRQLLLSDGMSELFKVQAWIKPGNR